MQTLIKNKQFLLFLLCPCVLMAQMSVKADRPTAKYAVGETATFIVQNANDGPATYSIKYAQSSELPPLSTGTVQVSGGQGYISFVATSPEFVHCIVSQYGQTVYAGAAFDPYQIQPIEAESADFDAYWAAQKAALAAVPISPNVYYRGTTTYVDQYNFDIALTDGKRAYGYLNIPRGAGSYPAIIQLPPYGSQANIASDDISLAERAGVISVYLSIHNNVPWQQGPNSYLDIGITDPMNYYLKYAILGVIRTIDYFQTRTDFNGQVGVIGVSQGGGLSILAAGIDNRIGLLANVFPALCEHPALKYNKPSGYPSFWSQAPILGIDANTILNTVKYYDAVTAAKRFKGVSWTTLAYKDDICFASTGCEAYNQLKGQKILTHLIKGTHPDVPNEFADPNQAKGLYAFFRRHFPATNNAPWPYFTKTLGYKIDAGNDIVLTNNTSIILRGSVNLENADANLPVHWEKIEGTGNVSFDNPQSLTTNATFSQGGTYRLRLVAEDMSTLAGENKYTTLSDDITITINGVVPVELLGFKGIATENGNELSWSTASEKDNNRFELERSADSKEWATLTNIKGKGNSNTLTDYQFIDKDPLSMSYYRLKQIDFSGVFQYSKVISLKTIKESSIQLFPNPVGNSLTIKPNDSRPPFDIKIYDALGRIWLLKTVNSNDLMINTTELIKGNYFIEIKNKEFIVVKKFIK